MSAPAQLRLCGPLPTEVEGTLSALFDLHEWPKLQVEIRDVDGRKVLCAPARLVQVRAGKEAPRLVVELAIAVFEGPGEEPLPTVSLEDLLRMARREGRG